MIATIAKKMKKLARKSHVISWHLDRQDLEHCFGDRIDPSDCSADYMET